MSQRAHLMEVLWCQGGEQSVVSPLLAPGMAK